MSNIKEILEERGKNYGDFDGHASISQALKVNLQHTKSWSRCTESQKEALEMICHKMARIVNGDPNYVDSWRDIIGYTQLVVNQLEAKP